MSTIKCRNGCVVVKEITNNVDVPSLSSGVKRSGAIKSGFGLKVGRVYPYVGKMKFKGIKFWLVEGSFYILFEHGNDRVCFSINFGSISHQKCDVVHKSMFCSQKCRRYSTVINTVDITEMPQYQSQHICTVNCCSKMQQSPVVLRIRGIDSL